MPGVTLLGDKCTGHGGFGARASTTANSKMTIGGKPVVCVGDSFDIHCDDDGCHGGVLKTGSSKLTLGGRPVGLVGSEIDCGSKVAEGSSKFIVAS